MTSKAPSIGRGEAAQQPSRSVTHDFALLARVLAAASFVAGKEGSVHFQNAKCRLPVGFLHLGATNTLGIGGAFDRGFQHANFTPASEILTSEYLVIGHYHCALRE